MINPNYQQQSQKPPHPQQPLSVEQQMAKADKNFPKNDKKQ
jgi:hypothetical protein